MLYHLTEIIKRAVTMAPTPVGNRAAAPGCAAMMTRASALTRPQCKRYASILTPGYLSAAAVSGSDHDRPSGNAGVTIHVGSAGLLTGAL
jgi:hypothetical protein